MTKSPKYAAASAMLIAALAMPSYGWAQSPTQSQPSTPPASTAPAAPQAQSPLAPAPDHPGRHAGHAGRQFNLAEAVEQHIKKLHAELLITPAQQTQWDQFAQVMRDNAQEMTKSLDDRAQKISSMSAVDSMSSYSQLAEQRAQDLVKLAGAFQTLYGSFSDQQKQAADTMFRKQAMAHAPHHAG